MLYYRYAFIHNTYNECCEITSYLLYYYTYWYTYYIHTLHIVAPSHTLTEWLWKSVTTISFLLFTATKWGPGCSRRDREGKRGKMSHPLLYNIREEVPYYFWTLKTRHTSGHKETKWESTGQRRDRAYVPTCKKDRHLFFFSSHSQWIHYLLKTGPDLLSFCSSAMFAPLFSKRKEMVHVRNQIERTGEFQLKYCLRSAVRATNKTRESSNAGKWY